MSALAAYEAGLSGVAPCWAGAGTASQVRVPTEVWMRDADGSDDLVLDACEPRDGRRVLDVGCGPGRLTAALAGRGAQALGIDLSGVAVRIALGRGAAAIQGDVFEPVPGEGTWACVLLADGNIGIGNDPVRLLRRMAGLLGPGGLVVADVERTGGVRLGQHHLTSRDPQGRVIGGSVPWARVGSAAVGPLAAEAGLELLGVLGGDGSAPTRRVALWRVAS